MICTGDRRDGLQNVLRALCQLIHHSEHDPIAEHFVGTCRNIWNEFAKWVRYGTPPEVLHTAEVVRYREEDIEYHSVDVQAVPSIGQIESEWRVVFAETFERNHHRWGLGVKNDGTGEIERRMCDGRYVFTYQEETPKSCTAGIAGSESAGCYIKIG